MTLVHSERDAFHLTDDNIGKDLTSGVSFVNHANQFSCTVSSYGNSVRALALNCGLRKGNKIYRIAQISKTKKRDTFTDDDKFTTDDFTDTILTEFVF